MCDMYRSCTVKHDLGNVLLMMKWMWSWSLEVRLEMWIVPWRMSEMMLQRPI